MATASINRGMLWTDLQERELPDGWRLTRLVRSGGRNAWFEATWPDGKPAIVSLTEALNDEEDLLARLRAAAGIHHPNVVAVREARLTWVDDTPVVLAVMEPTDENLADVLRERALEPEEARQLLSALLNGLAAIHGRRFTHGRMEVASVLAIGDTVKLRSDCLQLEGFAAGAGVDVRGVGRIVTQALTRKVPANENDPVLQLVPEPMGRAVHRALSGHATVEEMAALAGVRVASAMAPPAKSGRPSGSATAAVRESERPDTRAEGRLRATEMYSARVAEMPSTDSSIDGKDGAPAQMIRSLFPRRKICESTKGNSRKGELPGRWNYHRRSAPWVIGAAVGVIVATALMLHSWLGRGQVARATPASPRIVVEGAVPAESAVASPPATRKAQVWSVVVYTYRHQGEAEQRTREIGVRLPELRPGVMTTRSGDFLVTVGGKMNRAAAMALRNRVLRLGLPRDTYAQNFQQPGVERAGP